MNSMETRPRVLIVDDDEITGLVFEMALSGEGYEVRTATSVQSAVQLGLEIPFDILITDYSLPDGEGTEILARLAAIRPLTGIVISGYNDPELLEQLKTLGFIAHFTKPIEVETIVKFLKTLPLH